MKKAVFFYSEGSKLAADLYLPDGQPNTSPYPAVVLCHGFAGIKEVLLPAFAEAFAQRGFAALVFDYRGFGDSEGERGRLIHAEQVQDIRNALTFMQSLPEVDGQKIGLWGTSYGGANALVCTAADQRVKCLVVQLTFASGERVILGPLDPAAREKLRHTLSKVWQKAVTQNKSLHMNPGQLLTDEQSKTFIAGLIEKNPKVNVKIPFMFLQHTLECRPEDHLAAVHVPLLIIGAENDTVNPVEESRLLFQKAQEPKEFCLLPGATHYECYAGEQFALASQKAAAWFGKYLAAG
jgi:alpha-beta hydrolase superfamily lysophospholipase